MGNSEKKIIKFMLQNKLIRIQYYMKICSMCNTEKSLSEFFKHKSTKDGYATICKVCKRSVENRVNAEKRAGVYASKCRKIRLSDEDRALRLEQQKEYHKKYREEHADELRERKREYRRQLRLEGIQAYGGKCSCCGESQIEFLTLEHVHGRDTDDTTGGKGGEKAWMRLKKNGWPKDGFTILCFNCNCAKGIYGICPHQRSGE